MPQSSTKNKNQRNSQFEGDKKRILERLLKAAKEIGLVTWVKGNSIGMGGKTPGNNYIGYNIDVVAGRIWLTVHTLRELHYAIELDEVVELMSKLNFNSIFMFTVADRRRIIMQYPIDELIYSDLSVFCELIHVSMATIDYLTENRIGELWFSEEWLKTAEETSAPFEITVKYHVMDGIRPGWHLRYLPRA